MVGFYAEAAGADAAAGAAGAVDWLSHQGRMVMMGTGLRCGRLSSQTSIGCGWARMHLSLEQP